jgi:ribosome-associated translation inhibitor RaiA
MQVQVNTDDHIHGSESLTQWVQDEANTRLARLRDNITRLEVFLSDLDGSKSGINDKRCRLEARVAGRPPVSVTAEADKMAGAFIDAVDKLVRLLDTELGRVKDRHGRDTIRTAVQEQE